MLVIKPLANVTDETAQAGLPAVTDASYYCNRLRDGFYDVFFPPQTGNALAIQLALREPAELGNDVSPYDTDNEPGAAFHNPVQNNIWGECFCSMHTVHINFTVLQVCGVV
jgi:hypothetical protein